jgi:glycosyltransferase involved in cell wall biosynthesis
MTQCWHRVPGGTATSILRLADAVAATGEVDLVGVGPRGGPPDPGFRPTVPVARLPLPVPLLYDAWDRLRRPSVQAATGEVDVVHLTVPMSPPRSDAPLVATVHDLFPLTRPEWFTGRGARLMRRGLERIRTDAAAVLVPSDEVARDCARHGFDPERVRVVPWGSTPRPVTEAEVAAARRRFGLRGPYVLFVGTLEPRKGLAVLADALVHLGRPDVTLAVAGPAGWGDGDPARLGSVPGPVVRLGFLGDDDLAALRGGAGVCCAPSWAEGFGLPVLEALAAGAPVVTTAGTAQAEVAGDAAVLVEPGVPRRLAEALERVLDDDGLAARLRAAGPVRAATFTWEGAAAAVVDVYRRVHRDVTGTKAAP